MSDLPAERKVVKGDIKKSLLEAVMKFSVLGSFAVVGQLVPMENYFIKSFFGLVYFYLTIDALLEINASCIMWITGWYIPPMFDYPFLSQSPRDFWSRRWNMMVHKFVHKHFFLPMKKAGLPTILPVICIGVFTSLIHEYIVFFSVLSLKWVGQMSVFFLIHVLATVIQIMVYKTGFWNSVPQKACNRILNILLHTAWFVVTAPLFLKPFFAESEISSWLML
uniref:Wax synthase domain-containing protein n=1 Tax=Arcella intermedia TaxID=1963864 RepID=A0A6B2LH10_9EUKA